MPSVRLGFKPSPKSRGYPRERALGGLGSVGGQVTAMQAMIYPVGLRLQGLRCVVVGGGQEAARRALGLLRAGAVVDVIAAKLTPEIEALGEQVHLIVREYSSSDLDGAFLVILADRDAALAERVAADASERRLPFCAIDQPDHCTFINLAVAREGSLIVAVSTSGQAPAFASRLKAEIRRVLRAANAGAFTDRLARLRSKLPPERRAESLRKLLDAVRLSGKLELPPVDHD